MPMKEPGSAALITRCTALQNAARDVAECKLNNDFSTAELILTGKSADPIAARLIPPQDRHPINAIHWRFGFKKVR